MKKDEYKEQLDCSYSTARSKLVSNILVSLCIKYRLNICYRCNKEIIDIGEFSIDHKEPWRHKANAKELYFDLNNIAFSHKSCNYAEARCPNLTSSKSGYKGVALPENGHKKYKARINKRNIGSFNTAEEAARAYDDEAIKEFGDRAVTNKMLGLID